MNESSKVLAEVESTTEQYQDIAKTSASIYFSLQSMTEIYNFYQFSLKFFMNMVHKVLTNNDELKAIPLEEYSGRIQCIKKSIFKESYHKVYHAMLNKHKLSFALKLT